MKPFILLAMAAGLSPTSHAAEIKVTADQLPPAVQAAIKRHAAGTTVLGISKEQERGRLTYEVETRRDSTRRDMVFNESGSLLAVEQEVSLENIPAPAKIAIENKFAGGTVRKVEAVTQGSTTSYEADVITPDGKIREVAVNSDGSTQQEN